MKAGLILCGFMLIGSGVACSGATVSENMFLWNEANSLAASARSPEEYLVAARAYRNMSDRGIRNGAVYYNMGTALLNAGAHESAVRAFLHAERYTGFDPDLARNLEIAMARSAESETHYAHWYRIPLFWHFRLSTPARTMTAAAAFCLLWISLALRRLGAGRLAGKSWVAGLVVFVLFGASAATSLYQEANAELSIPSLPAEHYPS